MAFKVPSNQIVYNYTSGGEYIFKTTQKEYQGYYYENSGKTFAGKEFNVYAPELEKIQIKNSKNEKINPLLSSAATFIYGKISKIKNLPSDKIQSIVTKKGKSTTPITRYFAKKINSNPILIKEINKEEYDNLVKNPLYQVVSIFYPKGDYVTDPSILDEAELKMPGIKSFLLYTSSLD